MYRQMKVVEQPNLSIYCPKMICDGHCGKFHAKSVKLAKSSNINGFGDRNKRSSLRTRRAGVQKLGSLDSLPSSASSSSYFGSKVKPSSSQLLTPSAPIQITVSSNALTPNAASISFQHNQHSPKSQNSITSTVTLDDIIASARRKISTGAEGDDEETGMPDPVFFMDNSSVSSWPTTDNKANGHDVDGDNYSIMSDDSEKARRRQQFIQSLMDSSSSDDEIWISGKPPTMMIDEEQEDFDELLRATKRDDPYSNPVWRGSDSLSKRRHTLLEQRAKSANNDNDDNSSIDLSVADISGSQLSLNLNLALLQGQSSGAASSNNSSRWRPVEYEGNL